jgi:hypothetical protein
MQRERKCATLLASTLDKVADLHLKDKSLVKAVARWRSFVEMHAVRTRHEVAFRAFRHAHARRPAFSRWQRYTACSSALSASRTRAQKHHANNLVKHAFRSWSLAAPVTATWAAMRSADKCRRRALQRRVLDAWQEGTLRHERSRVAGGVDNPVFVNATLCWVTTAFPRFEKTLK